VEGVCFPVVIVRDGRGLVKRYEIQEYLAVMEKLAKLEGKNVEMTVLYLGVKA
jgi:hypothetical protein